MGKESLKVGCGEEKVWGMWRMIEGMEAELGRLNGGYWRPCDECYSGPLAALGF